MYYFSFLCIGKSHFLFFIIKLANGSSILSGF